MGLICNVDLNQIKDENSLDKGVSILPGASGGKHWLYSNYC